MLKKLSMVLLLCASLWAKDSSDRRSGDIDRLKNAGGILDEIMAALEGEQVGLDASLKLFEEGIELLRAASAELEKAETKVQMLLEKSDGSFELREMDL